MNNCTYYKRRILLLFFNLYLIHLDLLLLLLTELTLSSFYNIKCSEHIFESETKNVGRILDDTECKPICKSIEFQNRIEIYDGDIYRIMIDKFRITNRTCILSEHNRLLVQINNTLDFSYPLRVDSNDNNFHILKKEDKLLKVTRAVEMNVESFPVLFSLQKYLKKYNIVLETIEISKYLGALLNSLDEYSNQIGNFIIDKKREGSEQRIFILDGCKNSCEFMIHMHILKIFYLLQKYGFVQYKYYRLYCLWFIEHISNGLFFLTKSDADFILRRKFQFIKKVVKIHKGGLKNIEDLENNVFKHSYLRIFYLTTAFPFFVTKSILLCNYEDQIQEAALSLPPMYNIGAQNSSTNYNNTLNAQTLRMDVLRAGSDQDDFILKLFQFNTKFLTYNDFKRAIYYNLKTNFSLQFSTTNITEFYVLFIKSLIRVQ